MLENPQEKEKVSTKASQNPIIIYERNQKKNPSLNKKNEKKKHKKEWIAHIVHLKSPCFTCSKALFPPALEANTSSPFTKKGDRIDEMIELFKQIQINLPLLDVIKKVPSHAKFLQDSCI